MASKGYVAEAGAAGPALGTAGMMADPGVAAGTFLTYKGYKKLTESPKSKNLAADYLAEMMAAQREQSDRAKASIMSERGRMLKNTNKLFDAYTASLPEDLIRRGMGDAPVVEAMQLGTQEKKQEIRLDIRQQAKQAIAAIEGGSAMQQAQGYMALAQASFADALASTQARYDKYSSMASGAFQAAGMFAGMGKGGGKV